MGWVLWGILLPFCSWWRGSWRSNAAAAAGAEAAAGCSPFAPDPMLPRC